MSLTGQLGTVDSQPGNIIPGFCPVVVIRQGLGLTGVLKSIPDVTSDLGLASSFMGSSASPIAQGLGLASVFALVPPVADNLGMASVFSTPTSSSGPMTDTLGMRSEFAANSGDLANGRYRR